MAIPARCRASSRLSDPASPAPRCKLGTIVTADVIGRTMTLEQLGQHRQQIIAPELALDMDRIEKPQAPAVAPRL